MRTFVAFMKKEWMEHMRSGRIIILGLLFVLFGIMNPAVAKLTPWLLEVMADSMEESGMIITAVEVDAMTSWVQFFKNVPMALIAFVLLESSLFTKEYQSGTLVLALTKGLHRTTVLCAKSVILVVLWTVLYWMHYGITYIYNDFFWDNSIAKNLGFSVVCWWLFGLWVIALMVMFSTIASANTVVLVGTGVVVFGCYLAGMLPKIGKYLPTLLMDGNSLIYGMKEPEDYMMALVVLAVSGVICLGVGVPVLNRKRI